MILKSLKSISIFLVFILLAACSENKSVVNQEVNSSSIRLNLEGLPSELNENSHIRLLYSDGSSDEIWGLDSFQQINNVRPDSLLSIEVYVKDSLERVEYFGSVQVESIAGVTLDVAITLEPQFLSVEVSIPLGINNPYGIAYGYLDLSEDSITTVYQMSEDYKSQGVVVIPKLYFNGEYQWELNLFDQDSNLVFNDLRVIEGDSLRSGVYIFELNSLLAKLGLSLILGESVNSEINYQVPNSKLRRPLAGEIRITELMPNPKTSGDLWEYVEIYNLSTDSLLLDSCVLKKSSESGSSSSYWNGAILPFSYDKWGRDSTLYTNQYGGFTLLNSGSSLVLECSQVVIDSIDYSIVGFDNLLEQGHSIELKEDYDSWENKFDPESWCISQTSHTLNGIALFGTPGAKNECTSSD